MRACRRDSSDGQIAVALLVLIFLSLLLLNHHTQLMMDDYDYSFSWATGERLAGIGDILASQAAHYSLWGGRSVTHFLAQLFLYLGKPVFNVANALMYVLLLLEIHALAGGRLRRMNAGVILISHGLLMLLVPFFGVAFLWLDGACNYLWGTALALLPLLIARSEREGGFFDTDSARGYLAAPLCLIAGWTNENTACGILATMVLLAAYDAIRRRRVRVWRIIALGAQALGVALMLLAPGNFARAAAPQERGMIAELLYRFAVTTYCALKYAGVYALAAAAALVIGKKKGKALRFEWHAVLAVSAFLSAYALVGSPQISDRSFTAVIALAIALLLGVLADLRRPSFRITRMQRAALVLAVSLMAGVTGEAISAVMAHEQAWRAQEEKILVAKEAGEESVQIASLPAVSRFTMNIALEKDADAWPNSTLSKYYGIEIYGE